MIYDKQILLATGQSPIGRERIPRIRDSHRKDGRQTSRSLHADAQDVRCIKRRSHTGILPVVLSLAIPSVSCQRQPVSPDLLQLSNSRPRRVVVLGPEAKTTSMSLTLSDVNRIYIVPHPRRYWEIIAPDSLGAGSPWGVESWFLVAIRPSSMDNQCQEVECSHQVAPGCDRTSRGSFRPVSGPGPSLASVNRFFTGKGLHRGRAILVARVPQHADIRKVSHFFHNASWQGVSYQ